MRHRKRNRHFHRSKDEREALLRQIARSVILKGSIGTTVVKAKEARRLVDRLIQFGVRGNLSAYHRALQTLGDQEATSYLFKEVAPLFKKRQGGYTRLFRGRVRPGDGAELAILELVERKVTPKKEVKEAAKPEKTKGTLRPAPSKEEVVTPPPATPSKKVQKTEPPVKEKGGGFLSSLRKFLKPKDRS